MGTAPLSAQGGVSISSFLSLAEHRVDDGSGVERATGTVLGIRSDIHAGSRLDFGVSVAGGTLIARSAGTLDRDVGQASLEAGLRALPWLAIRAGIARRAYSTDIARQRWTIVSLGAEARFALIGASATGVLRAAWLPVVTVNGLDGPGLALATAAGMEYRWGRVSGGLFYELERCDFPLQAAVRRLEQLSSLTLRLAVEGGPKRRT